jgi:competence protein ComEC
LGSDAIIRHCITCINFLIDLSRAITWAVVAGVVFFTVRALLALIPGLTVRFPIKKWAAAAALFAAAFYLLLSGSDVATQRSFFMTAVVLIAVIVDRRAITFRTLAVSAMIVLAIAPEALVHPSFQSLGASSA